MSNYKTVFFTLGILQIILGISMFIPIIAQFIYSEIDSSFFGASIVTIIFGSLFFFQKGYSGFEIGQRISVCYFCKIKDYYLVIV